MHVSNNPGDNSNFTRIYATLVNIVLLNCLPLARNPRKTEKQSKSDFRIEKS